MPKGALHRPVTLMFRSLVAGLSLTLLTASLVAASAAAHEEPPPGVDVTQYFNVRDGTLVLTPLPPVAKNPTTWSQSGSFDPRRGLKLAIPLNNSEPGFVVDETPGVDGWISVSMSFKYTGTSSLLYHPSGTFTWSLVEGARSAKMSLDCRYGDPRYCERDGKEPIYRAAFPGHEGKGRPHTHGDGTSADAELTAGEFGWLLTYTVAPCSTLSCPILWGSYTYTFSVVVDGSTFAHFIAKAAPPPEAPAPPDTNATAPADGNQTGGGQGGNSTGPPSNNTGNNTGGQSGNKSAGSGSAGSRFLPSGYRAEPAGTASGASVFAVAAAVAVAGLLLRRRVR